MQRDEELFDVARHVLDIAPKLYERIVRDSRRVGVLCLELEPGSSPRAHVLSADECPTDITSLVDAINPATHFVCWVSTVHAGIPARSEPLIISRELDLVRPEHYATRAVVDPPLFVASEPPPQRPRVTTTLMSVRRAPTRVPATGVPHIQSLATHSLDAPFPPIVGLSPVDETVAKCRLVSAAVESLGARIDIVQESFDALGVNRGDMLQWTEQVKALEHHSKAHRESLTQVRSKLKALASSALRETAQRLAFDSAR